MIKKVNKIKNLGLVYNDYVWNLKLPADSGLKDFNHCNLIYGWTGAGKTTLSRLYSYLETGSTDNDPTIEYEIEDEQNKKYKQNESFNRKIRVFNQDYVRDNLKINEGKAKSITLILGGENKEISDQIDADQKLLESKNSEFKKINSEIEVHKKQKDKTFTEIAKTVYVAITGGAIRTYRKDHAENDFSKLTQKQLLSDEDLLTYSTVTKQNSKPTVSDVTVPKIFDENGVEQDLLEYIQSLNLTTKTLLSKTVESEIIQRLKDNSDISVWVEEGVLLHNKHMSVDCEFCGQKLPETRLAQLTKHFNEADKKLKEEVDLLVKKIQVLQTNIGSIICPDKANFYDELQVKYEEACTVFNTEKNQILSLIVNFIESLKEKKVKTTEVVEWSTEIDLNSFLQNFEKIKKIIESHNKKTSDFQNEKDSAVEMLKKHYLSTIYDEVKKIESEISDKESKTQMLENGDTDAPDNLGISGLSKRIFANQAKISSTHKACGDINLGIATFLGRDELKFEPHKISILNDQGVRQDLDDGYILKRNGKLVENLSDGEKTAIVFVYFTIHLKDKDFKLEDGIVVIDDPISSLDSNSLFQAFAFLKNSVENARQIFIFTHNFDFLKLLLNWRKNVDRGKTTGFYMIKNFYNEKSKRCAYIDNMDKELWSYESEYHYLFKILKEFKSDDTIGQAYPIPNIARKVLDTFLTFRVPCGGTIYKKVEKIKETTDFDKNKLVAIYKFVNDQSHITGSGFNPSLVPETQKNVTYLLEMIEAVFPEHYKILEESIVSS